MKTFNLIAASYAIAILGGLLICHIGELALGDSAKYIVFPLALALGFFSRRIAQNLLGYTLEESMKGTSDDESKS